MKVCFLGAVYWFLYAMDNRGIIMGKSPDFNKEAALSNTPETMRNFLDRQGITTQSAVSFDVSHLTKQDANKILDDIFKMSHVSFETRQITSAAITSAYNNHLEMAELKETNRQLMSRIRKDPMTGINNRIPILERLDEILDEVNNEDFGKRKSDGFFVAFLDLKQFKKVNDTYGSEAGDAAIKEFANIIAQTIRRQDIGGRWGGDEFVVVMPNNEKGLEALSRLQKATENMPVNFGDVQFDIKARVGIHQIQKGEDTTYIMNQASQEMNALKDSSKSRYVSEKKSTPLPQSKPADL